MDKKLLNFRKTFPGFNETLETDFSDGHAFDKDQLFDLRGRLGDAYKRVLDRAEHEKRELSPAEDDGTNYANELLTELNHEITRRTAKPVKSIQLHGKNSDDKGRELRLEDGKVNARYRDHFAVTPDSWNGRYDEFFEAVLTRKGDPRLFAEKRDMSGLTGVGGAFAMPATVEAAIIDGGIEGDILLERVRQFKMTARSHVIPAFDGKNHSGEKTFYGGYTAQWKPETSEATETDCALRAIGLNAHTLAVYSGMSWELQSDAPSLANSISGVLSRGLRFELEDEILNGNGVGGSFLGVLNSDALIQVNRQGAAAVSYIDLVNVIARLAPAFWADAIWCINPDCLPQIFLMQDPGNRYIYTGEASNVAGRPAPTLCGFPVKWTEKAQALGTLGDVVLFSPSLYALGLREGLSFATTEAAKWKQAITSFRMLGRFAGQPLLDEPIVPRHGSNTLSAFVALK